jgi:hypothetical protein
MLLTKYWLILRLLLVQRFLLTVIHKVGPCRLTHFIQNSLYTRPEKTVTVVGIRERNCLSFPSRLLISGCHDCFLNINFPLLCVLHEPPSHPVWLDIAHNICSLTVPLCYAILRPPVSYSVPPSNALHITLSSNTWALQKAYILTHI